MMASRPPGNPGGVPAKRPASLDRLNVLIGLWNMEASFQDGYRGSGSPEVTAHGGWTAFDWVAGRFFVAQRFTVDNPAAPSGMAIIGLGEKPDTFVQHYYDSRGIARVYQMSLDGAIWKLWRHAPGFSQRYTGHISGDGKTITGAWEGSADGQQWKHDFDLCYLRVD